MQKENTKKRKPHISKISAVHYFKLVFRSVLLIWAIFTYLPDKSLHRLSISELEPRFRLLVFCVWVIFAIEMILRFFPSDTESMGCGKQFKRNYIPAGPKDGKPHLDTWKTTFVSALSWIILNGIIGVLYFTHVIDDGWLLIISLFFSVSDMICILFFCPFQTWIMKNRCCTTCRIYNWDYLMMFTPLIFTRSLFTWSLVAMAGALLVRWEVTVFTHPERFSEEYNAGIRCANCSEKLCSHKKQLHRFWKRQRQQLEKIEHKLQERR